MLTQLVNLKDNELDVIAQYMGHDIRVHREHYRLPSGTVQVAKVAKLLMALDRGKVPTASELDDDTLEYDADPDPGVSSDDDNDMSPSESGKIYLSIHQSLHVSNIDPSTHPYSISHLYIQPIRNP